MVVRRHERAATRDRELGWHASGAGRRTGAPNTEILFGGGTQMGGTRDGLRFSAGAWLNNFQDIAIEGDYMSFKSESVGFSATGNGGAPILARPFFNMVPVDGIGDVLPPAEDAELVSFPGVVDGTVSVNMRSEFDGAGLRLRAAICCKEIGGVANNCNPCGPAVGPTGVSRIDVIGGYRYLSLNERIFNPRRPEIAAIDRSRRLRNP